MKFKAICVVLLVLNFAFSGCGGGASGGGAGGSTNNTQTPSQDSATNLVIGYFAIAKSSTSYQSDPTYQSYLQQYISSQSAGISSSSALYLVQMEERKIQIFLNNVIAYAGNINATQPINKTSVYAKLVEQQAIDTVLPSNVIATITASSGTSAQSMIGSTQASFSSNINFFYQTAYSQLMAL